VKVFYPLHGGQIRFDGIVQLKTLFHDSGQYIVILGYLLLSARPPAT
jgi:hypothetical protein